jgi:histone H3/H4
MEKISKSSINRLARRAGVKSLSEDCFDTVRNLIGMELNDVIKTILIVNNTKTIMVKDVYDALHIMNYKITQSNNLNTNSCLK